MRKGRILRWTAAFVPVVVLGTQLAALPADASGGPTVSISSPAPDGDNGWYRAKPTLTISASDPTGVTGITWTWSGASSGTGSQPFTSPYPTSGTATAQPSAPGTSTLNATATDPSAATGSASATVKWDPDPPSQPTGAMWTSWDGNFQQSFDSGDQTVCGSWNASTDAASGLRDYRVQVAETPDFAHPIVDRFTGSTTTSACFGAGDGIRYGHSYYFRVLGRDQAGNQSSWSGSSDRVAVTDQATGPAIAHAPKLMGFVGQTIPISLQATCGQGDACSARLFYRPTPLTGSGALFSSDWTRADLTQGPATTVNGKNVVEWDGAIPGTSVSTSGVDYFLEAEDNFAVTQVPGVTYVGTTYTPGIEPVANSWFHVNVPAPPLLVHQPPPFAPSGADIPLTLQATCSTVNCTATLYYRTTTDSALAQPLVAIPAWPRTQMQADPNPTQLGSAGQILTFRAAIPAASVDTRGVDYFFSVSDGSSTSWWPGTVAQGYYAPEDGMRTGYHHVHVLETPHVTHVPVTQSPYRQPISVDAQANCTTLLCTGTLYYRTTTADPSALFATSPMTVSQIATQNGVAVIALHGVIPSSVTDTRGVDYFFSVSDGGTTSWWPGTSSTDGYAPLPGTYVGYQHVRVLDPPHFYDVAPATAPALQDLTISAPVTCATASCTVTLSYAPSPTALSGPFTTISMTKVSGDTATPVGNLATWQATIPGPQVTTTGLSYYLKAFDGYTSAYSPGTSYWGAYTVGNGSASASANVDAAQAGVHPLRVLEPPHVVHAPVPTSYYNQPIALEAHSNCATPACTGTLHWRTTGQSWKSAPMTTQPPVPGTVVGSNWTYDATVPATDVTTAGVDYWIDVNDTSVTDSTPTYHVTVQAPTAILHVPVVTANPGTDVPIEAVVACSTPTCSATLSYRVTGTGALADPPWTTVAMTQAGSGVAGGQTTTVSTWVATIPASAVTTKGVDYYLRAADGSTTAYSPGTAYAATQVAAVDGSQVHYFNIHVAEPIHYVHAPVYLAPANDPIHITTQATCSTATCSGTLSYRTTTGLTTVAGITSYLNGLPPFTDVAMSSQVVQNLANGAKLVQLSADIPGAAVTTDGVDYYFRLSDGSTNAYFPGTSYVGGWGSVDGLRPAWQHVVVTAAHPTDSIGGHAFMDPNNDGVQQSTESGLPNVSVALTGAGLDGVFGTSDDTHATLTTDSSGAYDFTGLLPGTYRVDVDPATAPSGTVLTTPATYTVTLGANGTYYGANFGFRYDASLAGTVYTDANVNATLDTGESGISGVRVTLTGAGPDGAFGTADDVSYPAQTTNAAGAYTFGGLAPGNYRVDVDPATFPATMATTSPHPLTVAVVPHQAVTGKNFGLAYLPGAPTAVGATRGNASATVTWTAPASTGTGPITSYTVTASPGGATASVGGSTTTATVTGLTNGTSYTFTVVATNAVGPGPASAPSNAVTPATVPGAPTGVTATPGNAQATVSWTAPASNGGSAVTSYTVIASPGGASATVNAPATTATVTGLTNGTSYTFTVTAANAVGTGAASAPSAAVVPYTSPGAPTAVTATPGDRQATVTWTAAADNGSPITGYTVTASPGGATATVGGSTTTATVTGLTNGTSYTFTVVATNAAGPGPASAPSNAVTPRTTPGAPTNVAATAGSSSATVTWTAPANNGGAAVTSYTATASPGGASATVNAPATTATVSSLTPGTSYTFTVTATNAAGASAASSTSNAVVPYTTPSAPQNVTASAANASAVVSWSPPASDGYNPITSYDVVANPGGHVATTSASTTTVTVGGLTNGTTYTFTVTASNAAGAGPGGTSNAVTPQPQLPDAPSGVTATAGTASALVSWVAPSANGSPITAYTVMAVPGGRTVTVTGTATSAAVGGLSNGTSYTFTVRATNAVGTGPPSAPSAAVTPAATGRPYAAVGLVNVGSLNSAGQQGDADAWGPAMSADGRYLAFVSRAQNWAPNPQGYDQVWVRDLTTGVTSLVSVNTAGVPGNGNSQDAVISADGRYVAFDSGASDLVAGDTNGRNDVFVRDLQAGTTTLVSVPAAGGQANDSSYGPTISSNGRRIAFTSYATNMVAGSSYCFGNCDGQQVFLRDLSTSTTTWASPEPGTGINGCGGVTSDCNHFDNAANGRQAISGDGRYVVFWAKWPGGGALSTSICEGTYEFEGSFAYDTVTGVTTMLGNAERVGSDSTEGCGSRPAISSDGTVVAFRKAWAPVYRLTGPSGGPIADLNPAPAGQTANGGACGGSPYGYDPCGISDPILNSNGTRLIFSATATNLIAGDTNGREDVFYIDFWKRGAHLVSTTPQGTPPANFSGSDGSKDPVMSADATKGAFDSAATDLAANDLNRVKDVFLINLPQPAAGPFTPGELLGGGHNASEACLNCAYAQWANVSGYPVETATGNFWHTFDDLAVPGRGPALHLTHTYNSLAAATDGPLGFGWTHSYNLSLSISAQSVTVNQENGAQVAYSSFNGSWVAPSRVDATLVHNGDGTWTFTRRAREIFTFDSTGRLTGERDLNGYTTAVTYPSGSTMVVTDPAGRTLTFSYTGTHVTSVSDSPSPARVVSFVYDGSGNLTDVTDVGGGVTHFTYDSGHHLLTMLDPNQHGASNPTPITNVYDASGRVTSQSDYLGRTTSFDYTSISGSTKVTDPKGNVSVYTYVDGLLVALTRGYGTSQQATTSFSYDPATSGIASVTDPDGHTTTMAYDNHGNLLSATDAMGHSTSYSYDALEDPTAVTDAKQVTTSSTYDAAGNQLSQARPLLNANGQVVATQTTSYAHGDASHPGDVTSMTDPNGKVWPATYDAAGDLASSTDPISPSGDKTQYCYDSIGRRTATVSPRGSAATPAVTCATAAPAGFTTYVTYDAFGQVLSVKDPLGHISQRSYDADGNLKTTTDPDNNVTTNSYDRAGQLTGVQRADTTSLGYGYDADGNQTSYTDGGGHTRTYSFGDPALPNAVTASTDPDNRTTTAVYDRAGNRVSLTDPANKTTTFTSDGANRLTGISYSDGTTPNVGFGYDENGRRTTMTDGTGTSSYGYDSLYRLTSSTNGAGQTVSYGYDLRSSPTSIVYPGGLGTVTRAYDDAGRLHSVSDWLSHTTTFAYDADSDLTTQTNPNGTTATSSFDGADRLTGISHAPTANPSSPFASFTYGRDGADQLTSVTSTGVPADNHTYSYTQLNQLKNVDSSSTAYGYDHADNLVTLADGSKQAFDPANQLCWSAPSGAGTCASPPSGATSYGYDTRGNRISMTPPSGPATTLGYDQANRLASYGASATYAYDGAGLRASKTVSGTTTRFAWDVAEGLPLLLLDGTTAYVYGPGGVPLEQVSGSTVNYYHHDQLGSTRALSNSAGSVIATYTYNAYGKLTGSTGSVTNPFGYAGQYTDSETGLQYLRARYYDPATGQFLIRDPLLPRTQSAYGYAGGSPLNRVDPSGMDFWDDTGLSDAWDATGGKAVTWVNENPGTAATALAIGVCLTPGVNIAGCGWAAAGAYAVRAGERINDNGFSESLRTNAVDGVVTYATFGLVSAPAACAFGEGGVLAPGEAGIMDGASLVSKGFAKISLILPDIFGGFLVR